MLRFVAAGAMLAIGATFVYAQNLEAIKQRREVMGKIAKASVTNFKMSKGEVPFDLATVQAGLKTMQNEMGKFKTLFPNDSRTGGETDATPKIWEAKAEFEAAMDKFQSVAKDIASSVKDGASLTAEYPKMARDGCGACHREKDGFAPRLGESFKKLKQ